MKEIIQLEIHKEMFNDFYYPYLQDYSHKFEVHKGSAGSGKSHWVTQKVILKAISSKRKVLFIRKVGNTLRDSCWQLTLDILEQFHLTEKTTINKSEFKITFFNGSVFIFKGLDDPEKIKSIAGLTDVVIEESTELTLDDFTQLQLRLRANTKNCQIFLMFNPVSKANYVYSTFKFTPENQCIPIRKYDDVIVFCTTYKDNKFLNDDYIRTLEAMKDTNYIYYLIYVQGQFASLEKLVYTNWNVIDFDWKELKKENPDMIAIFGMDFGYINDASTLSCSLVNEETKELYIFDEHYEIGMLNNEIADMIKKKGYSKEIIIADSAERKSIDEIKRDGISRIKPARKGKGSILQGIQKLQQYRIYVHPSCINTIEELQNYSWKKDKQTNEYINEPIDSFNHLLDALRYAIQSLKKKPKLLNIRL